MRTIYKYIIPLDNDWPTIEMPDRSEVLHVAAQGDQLCLWALVNDTTPAVLRQFHIVGTGHPLGTRRAELQYLGTAHLEVGLVVHVFERNRR